MVRLMVVATLLGALAGCGAGGVEYGVNLVENERLADGSHRVVVEIVKTGTWEWESVEVRDPRVRLVTAEGGATAIGVELAAQPLKPIPDRFKLEFRTAPVAEDASNPTIEFQLAVEAKKHAGASSASGSRLHEIRLFD